MIDLLTELQLNPQDQALQWKLIQKNKGLIYRIAMHYLPMVKQHPSIDVEDLEQAGFLALIPAALSYDPGREKTWGRWASWYAHRAMKKTLGFRHSKDREGRQIDMPPPVLVSLDQPISPDEPDSGDLVDLIEDPAAVDLQEAAERSDLSALVREQVNALPERQASAVTLHDLEGKPMICIASEWGVSLGRVSAIRFKGMERLRHTCAHLWDEYHPNYLKYKSLTSFQRTGSSAVEDVALQHIH